MLTATEREIRIGTQWAPEPERAIEDASAEYAGGIVGALAMCGVAFACWIGALASRIDWSAVFCWGC